MNKPTPPPAPFDPQPRPVTGPNLGRIHDRVLHVLAEVDTGAPADRALANAFRRARDLGSHDRQVVKEEVYGLLRRRRIAHHHLSRALRALKKSPELFDPPMWLRLELLTHLLIEGTPIETIKQRDSYAAGRVPQLFARIAKNIAAQPSVEPSASVEKAAISVSLPTWLYQRLLDGMGPESTQRIGLALLERAPVTLRVDSHRITRDAVLTQLSEKGIPAVATPHAPHGIIIGERTDLRNQDLFKDGLIEVQDEGSQLIAAALNPQPNESILDACAGAGGKTLALWSALNGLGNLVAVEPDKKKYDALKRRLQTTGVAATTIQSALEDLPANMHGRFDRILVDAPCTGTGTLRRHPDVKWRLKPEDIGRETARQIHLLGAAIPLLKPGGTLIYATCSILWEENESIAERIVKSAPELSPQPLAALWGDPLAKSLGSGPMCRIGPGPSSQGPDGFFIAAFRRSSR